MLVAALTVAGAALGDIPSGWELWHRDPATSCTPPAVELSTSGRNGQVGSSFDLTAEVHCRPTDANHYVVIAQAPDEQVDPKNPHPEYYLSWRINQPRPGTYSRVVDLSNNPIGASATYYVIQVDNDAYSTLIANAQAGNFVLTLPDHLVISNQQYVTRAW